MRLAIVVAVTAVLALPGCSGGCSRKSGSESDKSSRAELRRNAPGVIPAPNLPTAAPIVPLPAREPAPAAAQDDTSGQPVASPEKPVQAPQPGDVDWLPQGVNRSSGTRAQGGPPLQQQPAGQAGNTTGANIRSGDEGGAPGAMGADASPGAGDGDDSGAGDGGVAEAPDGVDSGSLGTAGSALHTDDGGIPIPDAEVPEAGNPVPEAGAPDASGLEAGYSAGTAGPGFAAAGAGEAGFTGIGAGSGFTGAGAGEGFTGSGAGNGFTGGGTGWFLPIPFMPLFMPVDPTAQATQGQMAPTDGPMPPAGAPTGWGQFSATGPQQQTSSSWEALFRFLFPIQF